MEWNVGISKSRFFVLLSDLVLSKSVESSHFGTEPSSVLYIPAAPLCPKNVKYLAQQRISFEKGLTPPDFPQLNLVIRMRKF